MVEYQYDSYQIPYQNRKRLILGDFGHFLTNLGAAIVVGEPLYFLKTPSWGLKPLQLDCQSATRTGKNNLPANRKGYDTFETSVEKLSVRKIQIYPNIFV